MATPSASSRDGALSERRARLPSPAILVSGAALAVAGIWIGRTPIAENWARAAMLERGLGLELKINRLDFGCVEVDDLRLGSEKDPAFTADHARVRFVWKAPWAVELDDIVLERAQWRMAWRDKGLDLKGLEKLLAEPASKGGKNKGGMKIRRIAANDATILVDTDFGPVLAQGRFAGNLAAQDYGANFSIKPGRMRGPGLDAHLKTGQISARIKEDVLNARAVASGEQIASAWADARNLQVVADLTLRGMGGPIDKLAGALDIRATGAGLESYGETFAAANAQVRIDKADGPVDRVSWTVDANDLGGAWMIAPAATFAGGFSGALPIGATLDGRGGWSFTAPEAQFGAETRVKIREALIDGSWPDPLKSPFAAAGQSFLRAGEGLAASASGDMDASKDGVRVRALRADIEARSGAKMVLTSAPNAAALALGPSGLSGQGAVTMEGGGAPPLTIQLAQLRSLQGGGWSANASASLAPWKADDSAVSFNAPSIAITMGPKSGSASLRADALYSGPIGGGRIEKMSLKTPADIGWNENGWSVAAKECPRVAAASWNGAGLTTGAFAGALCPENGILAQTENGKISGRMNLANVSIPARMGEGRDAPRLALKAANASIALHGDSAAPHFLISVPNIAADVTTRSEDDGKDVLTGLSARVFTVDMSPTDAGMAIDLDAQGGAVDLFDTTLEVVDATANVTGIMAPEGLNADITGVSARVRDPGPAPLVTDLLLTGQGLSQAGRIGIDMVAQPEIGGPSLANIRITHNLEDGKGRAIANTDEMRFTAARQPQDIFPTLKGVVADVHGAATGLAQARWGGDAGFATSGSVKLDDLDFSTFSLGPVDGVNGTIRFDDLLKTSTPPGQHIEAKLLNPGVPVENMSLDFQLQSLETMRIEGGEAKVVGGRFLIEPVTWVFGPQRQQFALAVEDAPIQEILKLFNNPDLKGTGVLRGRIPMAIEDGHMYVENAHLEAIGAGALQVNIPAAAEASADNKFVELAFNALKDLQFTLLAVDVNGQVDGRLENKLTIKGRSPTASNLPFVYNIGLSAQILPLIQQARYIYDKSAIGEYTRAQAEAAKNDGSVKIDVAPAPKE